MSVDHLVPDMWLHVCRNLVRTFRPAYVPAADEAALSPRYCYATWLRHLVNAWQCGLDTPPRSVVELGPGSSQGVGLAALLSGATTYTSLDAIDYGVNEKNLEILTELEKLFAARAPIPGPAEMPGLHPQLEDYSFPHHLLTAERMNEALEPDRVASIRAACRKPGTPCGGIELRHVTVGDGEPDIPAASVDLILSQSVLTLVPDLDELYGRMYGWLRPVGVMTHQLDYNVDLTFSDARYWNSHWGCSDLKWSLLKWRQAMIVNRYSHSAHVDLMNRHGFRVLRETRCRADTGLPRNRLAPQFRNLPAEDLSTRATFFVAMKPK